MYRRYVVVLALAVGLLAGCGSGDEPDRPEGSRGSQSGDARGARKAVESYVTALNSRDTTGLIKVGGVPDDSRSRREAHRILADKGGRNLSDVHVQVDFDMGPDVGSAKLRAKDGSGGHVRDTFTVMRDGGAWHLVVFSDRPGSSGKETSST